MIQLTVALPVWNSKSILWLALEGLCRQKVSFKWELLIMEEQIKEFGIDEVTKYAKRLEAAGCASLRYMALEYRVPLPHKWKSMADKRSASSNAFLLQAADDYPDAGRLQRTFDKINEGYDWVQHRRGYMYGIKYKKIIEFDQRTFGPGCRTGFYIGISTKELHKLPDSFLSHGIDNWLYRSLQPKKVFWFEEELIGAVGTDGLNNISIQRRRNYVKPERPFVASDKTIDQIVPSDIAERLKKFAIK